MNKNIKLLLVALLSVCTYFTQAQTNDTLEIKRNEKGKIEFARFKPSDTRKLKDGAVFLKSVLKAKVEDDFNLLKETTDKFGVTHRRYQQYYKEIKVDGAEYLIHGKNGSIETINGNFQDVETSTIPVLTEAQALAKALSFVNAKKYKWEDATLEKLLKQNTNNPNATYYPKGELIIAKDYLKGTKVYKLAWMFTISSLQPNKEQLVYVDADTGEIINTRSLIEDTNTSCTAETLYSGTVGIIGDSFSGGFRLSESRNGVNVQTLNLQHSTNISNAVDFVNSSTSWTTGSWSSISADKPGLDVHWGAEKVLDYWNTVHNRNSIDGNGITVLSYVHYGTGVDNAYWFGGANNHYMVYGDGSTLPPLTALDICSHEFGHGINEFTANVAQGTSGTDEANALNEGLSDIWGACVENASISGKQTWLLGEDLFTSTFTCIRNLQNPKSTTAWEGQHPDTYHGTFWNSGGEPHFNSTVLSHWFYLLSQGGSGTNDNSNTYSVNGIGITDAASIVYQAETNYLVPGSTYANARTAMIQAAIDLFGAGSCEEIAVTNAWYAVGVGSAYPAAYISGDGIVCSTSNTYTIQNLPTGATVAWSASPSGIVSISSPTSTQTTITKTTDGEITLTASINVCGTSITRTLPITVGVPVFSIIADVPCQPGNIVQESVFTASPSSASEAYHWRWVTSGSTTSHSITATDPEIYKKFPVGSYRVYAWTTNACGDNSANEAFVDFNVLYCPENMIAPILVSPNPASTTLNVEVNNEAQKTISYAADIETIEFVDKSGNVRLRKQFGKGMKKINLSVSHLPGDVYTLRVFDGKGWSSYKIIIQN